MTSDSILFLNLHSYTLGIVRFSEIQLGCDIYCSLHVYATLLGDVEWCLPSISYNWGISLEGHVHNTTEFNEKYIIYILGLVMMKIFS